MSNGWQGSGYDFDTCHRMGWSDDMRGAVDDITRMKRAKVAHDVAVSEQINKELENERKAKSESVQEPKERQVERDGLQNKEGDATCDPPEAK